MSCLYCECYAHSLRRLGTEADGSKAKKGSGRRVCETTKAWKSADDEVCDEFQPVTNFWCDRLKKTIFIDACRMKKQTGSPRVCKRCSQGKEITDVIRLRARMPKPEVVDEPEKNCKPVLLRRKK